MDGTVTIHDPTFTVEDLEDLDRTFERLVEFYEHNGYGLDERSETHARLSRGRRHAGWWASEMTRLYTEVSITDADSDLEISYRIQTTGQLMDDEDREFWGREADAATDYGRGDGDLLDLRPRETERASEVTSELRRTGIYTAAFVFLVVAGLATIARFLGWL